MNVVEGRHGLRWLSHIGTLYAVCGYRILSFITRIEYSELAQIVEHRSVKSGVGAASSPLASIKVGLMVDGI